MSWENFYYHDSLKKKSEEINRRKLWANVQGIGDETQRAVGMAFAAALTGQKAAEDVRPRAVKTGQVFLHSDGLYSAIVKKNGALRWMDVSKDGAFITEDTGQEAIGMAIDRTGEWMKVADSIDEFIKLMMDGVLGTTEEARKKWGGMATKPEEAKKKGDIPF